ncbi:multicopper oxidase family protein [Plantactinospora endophytica]|uniref:Multicopper oxidase n=1 Tax=Plantactinospora endophytica TaxID=673535 RepID=A0ABQ4E6Z0_9ACTN|nr:multicopper oxidase domain-containing protein [Plantactinospora endophytica]GIG90477.1 multicopper oxidase [Plantactinospora endophytica]
MVSRRNLIAASAAGGAGLLLPRRADADASGPSISPAAIPKYVTELRIPASMPGLAAGPQRPFDEYVISVRQFRQQVLPPGLPATTVWGYGAPDHPATFGYPACTVEARVDRPVRVTWVNELLDGQGRFLPHLLPVDPTVSWANPGGGDVGRDSRPHFDTAPDWYAGPVPIVTHLHGAHTQDDSDGYPEAWYLPNARDIPDGFARYGSAYASFARSFQERQAVVWQPGSAVFQYPNDQRATTLWYHDHTMGMTRLNVYAGPAGFYLLRGGPADLPPGVLPGPAPDSDDPAGTGPYEIPLLIQDRSFTPDGELRYPAQAEGFGHAGMPGPASDGSSFDHLVFGDTMVVNGRTWPLLTVEPRRYRLRLLNGCNSRFLLLRIASSPTARPASSVLPFWQVGSDGGFLPRPVPQERLLLGSAERIDVVVDFTGVPEGTALYLVNEGPDRGYTGGEPGVDFEVADPQTTGQVLKFLVGRRTGADHSVPPEQLRLPEVTPLGPASRTRQLSLNIRRADLAGRAAVVQLLGTVAPDGSGLPHEFHSPITENPMLGATEIWEFHNFTPDAHLVHIHQVQFQVVGRGRDGGRPPEDPERGFKDTVVVLPGHVTRVKARFDTAGRFTWHCHILEHEDNEMMLPYHVGPMPAEPLGH